MAVHYARVYFGRAKDNSPEIYDFLFRHMAPSFREIGVKAVALEIERLEPIDEIYTNLEKPKKEIKKIFDDFAKSHHLKEKASLTFTKEKTSLSAKLAVKNLGSVLNDYNTLFDIFFTDLIIKAGPLTIDMMDGFNNSLLIMGNLETIGKFEGAVKKRLKKTKFVFSDSLARK